MSIKMTNKYSTHLAKKYGSKKTVNDVNYPVVSSKLRTFSNPVSTITIGGARHGWEYTYLDRGDVVSGSIRGFASIDSYFEAPCDITDIPTGPDYVVLNFWNPSAQSYQPVTLSIREREELLGPPFAGWGDPMDIVRAHDLHFSGANKSWPYDVSLKTINDPSGSLDPISYYITDSPFVSCVNLSPTVNDINNLRIVPEIFKYVRNDDGNWAGLLGFVVYRKLHGVVRCTERNLSIGDIEIKTFTPPDERAPFGSWLIDIGSLELSKDLKWFDGSYTVNKQVDVTIE